ncbi:MAG TPA: hypothetical protein PLU93_10915 [Treponemataceae bacterium]|nr:hypothetical protein [Treponemataceae bacterium]
MKKVLILCASLACFFGAHAQTITGYDNLLVTVAPIPGTTSEVERDESGYSTVTFEESKGAYALFLTLYPVHPSVTLEDMRKEAQKKGKALLSQSVEKELTIQTLLNGDEPVACYYALTDKDPKKGEYEYLIQGYVRYAHLVGYFTFLYHSPDDAKKIEEIGLPSLVESQPTISKTENFEKIKLTEDDMRGYEMQYIMHYYSRQQMLFYQSQDAYESVLPKLTERYTQSVCRGETEGTIFYYYFDGTIESKRAFLEGLFYGEDGKPSKEHPETFICKGNLLVVFSYPYRDALAKELETIISSRIR